MLTTISYFAGDMHVFCLFFGQFEEILKMWIKPDDLLKLLRWMRMKDFCQRVSSQWITEEQAFFPSYDLAPPPSLPSVLYSSTGTHRKTEKERQLADGRGGRGGGRSQIIWRRESLVLYTTFNSLWFFSWAKNVSGKAHVSGSVLLNTSQHDTTWLWRVQCCRVWMKESIHSSIL